MCFLCLFLLFVPECALPRYFTGEWGCWHAAGAMLVLGLPPLAWAVSHTLLPAPHATQASPHLRPLLLSPLQERLQGEAVRDAVPGPGCLRSGTWDDPWDLLFGCGDAWTVAWAELGWLSFGLARACSSRRASSPKPAAPSHGKNIFPVGREREGLFLVLPQGEPVPGSFLVSI